MNTLTQMKELIDLELIKDIRLLDGDEIELLTFTGATMTCEMESLEKLGAVEYLYKNMPLLKLVALQDMVKVELTVSSSYHPNGYMLTEPTYRMRGAIHLKNPDRVIEASETGTLWARGLMDVVMKLELEGENYLVNGSDTLEHNKTYKMTLFRKKM